ncbi:uncharacterized protein LOC143174357 [Nomia melanderi]|uniref:uncharacterized protein LOC143174357 n=1 Tax=Nomia melanderi TaxID=2448451 RepID=UPI003FCE3E76
MTGISNAEAIVIVQALKTIKNQQTTNSIMFTDSMRVILSIQKMTMENEIITNIIQLTTELYNDNYKVTFAWVLAHHGINGNDITDKAANEATMIQINRDIKVPVKDIKKQTERITYEKWENKWTIENSD